MSFTAEPTFKQQAPDTPISEVALRLVRERDGDGDVIGTAVMVGAGPVAITAGHNLDEIVGEYNLTKARRGQTPEIDGFALRLYQIVPGPHYVVWNVVEMVRHPVSDIAILRLQLHGHTAPKAPTLIRHPAMLAVPPQVGDPIVGFGYHKSRIEFSKNPNGSWHIELIDAGSASTGAVLQVCPEKHDSGMLKWPGYRVNARIEPGMSGGPVMNRWGQLCGILCSSLSAESEDGESIGYVTTLWPLLQLTLPETFFPHDSGAASSHRAVIDLVLSGRMGVDDLHQIDPRLFPGRESAIDELAKRQQRDGIRGATVAFGP